MPQQDAPAAQASNEIPLFATDSSGFIDADGNILDSEDGEYNCEYLMFFEP